MEDFLKKLKKLLEKNPHLSLTKDLNPYLMYSPNHGILLQNPLLIKIRYARPILQNINSYISTVILFAKSLKNMKQIG